MEILIQPTAELAEKLAARLVATRLRTKPELVLGCATGRTMEGLYKELEAISKSIKDETSRIKSKNGANG